MSNLVFLLKILLELSSFLMLKTKFCQNVLFYAATVDINLIELRGPWISKNWLFVGVVQ